MGTDVSDVELVIPGQSRDIGGFAVARVLPSARRRAVGPFLFLDEMGPAEIPRGEGISVLPHPHVCLATVTYLFDGEVVHRDSLGTQQSITPGAVNWMTAGRGIVHSERAPEENGVKRGGRIHGLQLWVALPQEHEETEPAFQHVPAGDIPSLAIEAATVRVLAGEAFGLRSPVKTHSRLFYVDIRADGDAMIEVPEYPERAAYPVAGCIQVGAETYERGAMVVFAPERVVRIELTAGSRVVLLGGESVGPRHMYWNFVASSKERIERAKEDWRAQRFPKVPGDEVEFIPLPDDPLQHRDH